MLASVPAGVRAPKLWLAGVLVGTAGGLGAAVVALVTGVVWDWQSALAIGGEVVHLRLDAVSALFLALLGLIGGAGAVYGREYWTDRAHPRSARQDASGGACCCYSLGWCSSRPTACISSSSGSCSPSAAIFSSRWTGQRREVREAGWLYLAASHVATLCLFAFFTILAARTGSWELGPMRDGPDWRRCSGSRSSASA